MRLKTPPCWTFEACGARLAGRSCAAERAWKDAGKMAMNVKNRDAFYPSADYCDIYTSQPVNYGDCSHYFPRITGKIRQCFRNDFHCNAL